MLLLTGESQHVIDDKGRVLISNKLRSQIDSEEHGSDYYLVMGPNGVLCLYPEKCYEKVVLAMAPTDAAPDEMVLYERMTAAMASKVELDSQGRLLVNERLRKRANLGSQVTLVGVRDHIELWNSDQFEQYIDDHMEQYQRQMAQARKTVLQNESKEF